MVRKNCARCLRPFDKDKVGKYEECYTCKYNKSSEHANPVYEYVKDKYIPVICTWCYERIGDCSHTNNKWPKWEIKKDKPDPNCEHCDGSGIVKGIKCWGCWMEYDDFGTI